MGAAEYMAWGLDCALFAAQALQIRPDPWQAAVMRGNARRLLLNCSRQSGKSTTAAIKGLHRALYWPGSLILLISPSLRQSGELFRKVSDLLQCLPVKPGLREDNKLTLMLDNRSRIVSLPSSEATVRGFSGVDLIIEDEAARVPDDLYMAMRPMLAVSGGQLILMSTPFGKRGHFFEEWEHGGPGWQRTRVTAPEILRISAEFLDEERRSLGDWWYRQEYGCEFVETVDQLFGYDLVMAAITSEVKPLFA